MRPILLKGSILSRIVEGGLLSIILYTPLIQATKGIGTLTATYILILFLSMLWLLRMTWEGSGFVKTPLNLPLTLFLFFALLSTLFSINRGASLSELYKVILFILLYFLLINNLKEKYQFRFLLLAVLGIGGIVAGYGLYQYFSLWPDLTEIASTFPPNPNSLAGYLLLIIPLAFVYALFASSKWLSRMGFVISFLTYLCLFATYSRGGRLALFGSLILFLILIVKYLKRKELLRAKWRFLALALLLILLSGTFSLLRLIPNSPSVPQIPQVEEAGSSPRIEAQGPRYPLREYFHRGFTPLAGIFPATVRKNSLSPLEGKQILSPNPPNPQHRNLNNSDASSDILLGEPLSFRSSSFQRTTANKFIFDRLKIWGRTLEIIRDYPLLGTGMGTYGIIFRRHKIPAPLTPGTIACYGQSARFAHNEYLQIAAETGLPSLVIFLWIIILIFRTGLRKLRISSDAPIPRYPDTPVPQYLTIGLLSGLTGVLLHSLVDFVLRPPATDILFIYFAALIMLQAKTGDRETGRQRDGETGKRRNGEIRQPDSLFRHLYQSRIIRSSFIICVTILLISQVTLPLLAHRHYGKGIGYQKNKAFDQAISSYLIAQKLDPTNDQYHKNLGDLYRHLAFASKEEKKFWLEKATKEYEKMVLLSPEDNHYRRDLGVIYWLVSQGRNRLLMNKAIAQFRESLRIDPTFPFSFCALGVIYNKMGWDDKAIEKFEKAVYYEPNYIEAHYNLAILYSKKGLCNKALSEYKKIIEIEQKNLFPKISCGYEGALLKFNYAQADLRLATLYERGGRPKEAKAEYEYLLKIRPNFLPAKEALARLTKSQINKISQ